MNDHDTTTSSTAAGAMRGSPVDTFDLYNAEGFVTSRFLALAAEAGHSRFWGRGWTVDATACLRTLDTVEHLLRFDGVHGTRVVTNVEGAFALVYLPRDDTRVDVQITGSDDQTVAAAVATIRGWLPFDAASEGQVTVDFWTLGRFGPASRQRRLATVAWDDVRDNYAPATSSAIGALMAINDGASGKLVLWHGEPGCGKTYALRAIMAQYAAEADFHYVTDPDRFLGDGGDYLLHVITQGARKGRRSFLILEDAGELLTVDARERVGQGLSRLLNVTDGLVGQGLSLLILITTNEDIRRMHGAVIRPGRCLASVKFERFDREGAILWLKRRGVDAPDRLPDSSTLAELYGIAAGAEPTPRSRHFGF